MTKWRRALSIVLSLSMMLSLVTFDLNANADGDAVTVTWENWDGAQLKTEQIEKGTAPVYSGALPAKEDSGGHSYLLMGWRDAGDSGAPVYYASFPAAEADVTYRAVFSEQTRRFVVSFVNYDGTLLFSKAYDAGTSASDVEYPAAAERPSDAQYQYAFAGWDRDVETVTADAVYTAVYTQSPRVYTLTWEYGNGADSTTSTAACGSAPEASAIPANPKKSADEQYTYTFSGWAPSVTEPVTGDTTYTAQYTRKLRKYTVNWKDAGLESLGSEDMYYGVTPVFKGTVPEIAGMTFLGWSTDPEAVTPDKLEVKGDVTYYAIYSNASGHKLTFMDDAGHVISRHIVADGTVPGDPNKPAKAVTDEKEYTFQSWDPEFKKIPVKADAEYTAVYQEMDRTHQISFWNWNGKAVASGKYKVNQIPAPLQDPARKKDERYTYDFSGWSPERVAVAGEAYYTAQYTPNERLYEVRWMSDDTDGATVMAQRADCTYDDALCAAYPGSKLPTKAATAAESYRFVGWRSSVSTDGTAVIMTPQFAAVKNRYPVYFVNFDGEVLDAKPAEYGAAPEYSAAQPAKAQDQQHTYSFVGWEKNGAPVADLSAETVEGGAVYKARFTSAVRQYTVTFVDENGTTVLKAATAYDYGTDAADIVQPATPTKPNTAEHWYAFVGWDPQLDMVTGDVTYRATYDEHDQLYAVTWYNDQDPAGEIETTQYKAHEIPQHAGPGKEADAQYTYTFRGWKDMATETVYETATPLPEVMGAANYQAVYDAQLRSYTISFVDGERQLGVKTLEYGAGVSFDGDTGREPTADKVYTFSGWKKNGETVTLGSETVTGDAVYEAQYTAATRQYTVSFVYENGSGILSYEADYNSHPQYNGPVPTKTADYYNTYAFDGWKQGERLIDKDALGAETVTGDVTYTAHFAATPILYTVIWQDGNDEDEDGEPDVLLSDNSGNDGEGYLLGDIPAATLYDPGALKAPTKAATKAASYVWTGEWELSPPVAGTVIYRPVFQEIPIPYTVVWLAEDGITELERDDDVLFGQMPEYNGVPPTKPSDAQYDYTLAWTPVVKPIDGEDPITYYTATFTPTLREYTVAWQNDDGTVLETDANVPYGNKPQFDGAEPEKADTAEWDYTFDGWAKNGTKVEDMDAETVEGNVTYKAVYTKVKQEYPITWLDANGDPYDVDQVPYGEMQTAPATPPEKPSDDQYDYVFAGWDKDPEKVTGPQTYTPIYTRTLRKFTVTWTNEDGTVVLETDLNVPYGTTPHYDGDTPTKGAEFFIGWTKDGAAATGLEPVTGDVTYRATFRDDPTGLNKITWLGPDGEPIDTTYVPDGETPTHTGPTKPADKQNTYTFDHWEDEDGNPPGPADQDKTYTPVYTATPRSDYQVIWKDHNGRVLATLDNQPLNGDHPGNYPNGTPTRSGYTFKSWSQPVVDPGAGTITYTAQYTQNGGGGGGGGGGGIVIPVAKTVPITWVVNGVQTRTEVPEGEIPTYPNGIPSKPGMTFIGWTPTVVPAKAPATYTAQFSDTPADNGRVRTDPTVSGVADWLETGEHIIYYRGYPDGTIQPYGNIARSETAMILYRLLLNKDVPITASFADVDESRWFGPAVLTLASLGIINGYEDGTFRPDDPITRVEFTVMCARFAKAAPSTYSFTDVPEDYWAYKDIMTAAGHGWIDGYTDGTFRPGSYIARCEAATVVNRMLGRAADREFVDAHESELIYFPDLYKQWYYYDMIEGTNAHDYTRIDGKETWNTMYDK